jgi:patatin-related protein
MAAASHQAEYTQEVRFAVVMYGGVSLAIYINGIAQELLRMVRSTSASQADGQGNRTPVPAAQLTGTERVYRRLSCLLSDPELLRKFRASLESDKPLAKSDGSTAGTKPVDIVDERMAENTVNTRFVVDILSGTSAGGINAIYLAKALVNDQKLDELKTLWVTEGDIALLINDKKSVAGLHLTNQQPPQSLLNSRRMYFKLLNALHGMEKTRKSAKGFISPHVDELDLFITTTDIEGTLVPLRLSDTVVYERRHRNVFHFKYGTPEATGFEKNDFLARNDPFLAFAARCTSSFPFAFEPMRLCDIDEVLDRFAEYDNKETRKQVVEKWQSFFKDYKDPLNGKPLEFGKRSYGDGGYLDNKPFSYATETLMRRDAPVVVDRKLIYIEPSPEHPEDEPPRTEKYQALENVKAALLDLPTYEAIREDLQRVMDRNELLKRVNRITNAVERDLDQSKWTRPRIEAGEWAKLDLAGMVQRFGIYYIPYRRLRISSTTDELAKLIARFLDLDVQSAQFTAVRHLIHAWREELYPDYHPEDGDKQRSEKVQTANQFLIDFDFKYWIRRITFIRGKIDQLYSLIRLPARQDGNGVDEAKISAADAALLERLKRLRYHPLDYAELPAERKLQIQNVLSYLKCEFNEIYKNLRIGGRLIQSRPDENSDADHRQFAKAIEAIKLAPHNIDHLLGLPPREPQPWAADSQPSAVTQQEFSHLDDNELTRRAKELLFKPSWLVKPSPLFYKPGERWVLKLPEEPPELIPTELGQKFINAGAALSVLFHKHVADETWTRGRGLLISDDVLKPGEKRPEPKPRCKDQVADSPDVESIREYLWRYFSQFDDFDQISFPILFGTEVGETDVIDVLRISPEDATSLIDERAERHKPNGRKKLAGTALHHFGAFLDQVWRQNDILWGRLDGSERLITAMLPEPEDKKVRAQLIAEAHGAILVEELTEESRAAVHVLITESLIKMSAGMTVKSAVAQVLKPLQDETLRNRLETVVRAGLENENLLGFIKSSYEVNRDLDPKLMLRSIARSTQVIGKMFEDMANQQQLEGKRLAWIARMGQFFWGLVEVAVPGSLLNLFFFHWLKILYAFEIFLIVGSILLNADKVVTHFGWTAFGLTAALNVIVLLLGDYIRGKGRWRRAVMVLLIAAVLFLATLGFSELAGWGLKDKLFAIWNGATTWLRSILP